MLLREGRWIASRWWLVALVCFLGVCAAGFAGEPAVPYKPSIEGVDSGAVRGVLEGVSDTFALEKRPPATRLLLQGRVDRDVPRLVAALNGLGYYDAEVRAQVDDAVAPVRVEFQVSLGPAYTLSSVEIGTAGSEAAGELRTPGAESVGLRSGEPVRPRAIVEAESKLLDACRRQGYPFARMEERRVVVDRAAKSVAVSFRVAPGPAASFGAVTFSGLASVEESFVRTVLTWREDDRYNAALLDEFERRLIRLGLFSSVKVAQAEALDAAGALPIAVVVTERKPRTVGAGLGYRTDEGPSGRVAWEHRNLLHRGERLEIDVAASSIENSADVKFRKPAFLRSDQTLKLELRLAHDDPDAFESSSLRAEASLERAVSERLHVGAGLALRRADVKQFRRTRRFDLLSVPTTLSWDAVDNPFDPAEGRRVRLKAAPYADLDGFDFAFLKTSLEYVQYLRLSHSPSIVFAGRAAVGTLLGSGRRNVPADERFFAGGSGSIRGYPYQSAGPVRGDNPIGGRSMLELGGELRFRLTERLGLVTFVEGGAAFDSMAPDLSYPLRLGAGMGLRYFTSVGPIRFDVAVPINPPDNADDPFQVYISLGHAF